MSDHIGNRFVSQDEADLRTIAARVLPAGNFGNLETDVVVREGAGGRVRDESGNELIDYLLGSGPMLIGHGHPAVLTAVTEQISQGLTFFVNNRHGILLAEAIVDAVACAEKVRFVSTGSEAAAYAMRLVRAYRRKSKILKFEGAYHGMSDYGLMSLAPQQRLDFPKAVPHSAGIPQSVQEEMLIAPFNDLETTSRLIRHYKDELAGVIVEPFQRLLPPVPGFLEGLRAITAELGIPLVFDEIVTGFRLAYGGAQELYGVVPDLCTLGKACGGGFPLAAIAGRDEIMSHFDRGAVGAEGFVFQHGTLSGNPVAAVAGLATLRVLKAPDTYQRFYAVGQELIDSLAEGLKRVGLPGQVVGAPPMFDVVFAEGDIRNYRDTRRGDPWLMKRFNTLLREEGILKGESKYYLSTAHTAADVRATCDIWETALKQLAREHKSR